ncbi:MAG: MBL fold metallo-hydrolase [Dehalococcoidia bacterium]
MNAEVPQREHALTVLRRWNSFTPLLPTADAGPGGGYLLQVTGPKGPRGIVIDPGFDFLRNLQDSRHSMRDVHAVFMTHSHVDHMDDFEGLLTARFEGNEAADDLGTGDKRHLDLFLSLDSFQKLAPLIEAQKSGVVGKANIRTLAPGMTIKLDDYGVTVTVVGADHSPRQPVNGGYEYKDDWLRHAVGLIVQTHDPRWTLGFTSDTRLLTDASIFPFGECDILVAHLGTVSFPQLLSLAELTTGPELDELLEGLKSAGGRAFRGGVETTSLYALLKEPWQKRSDFAFGHAFTEAVNGARREDPRSGHLLFRGVYAMFENRKNRQPSDGRPWLGIISEFGLELGSLRNNIADALNHSLFNSRVGDSNGRLITGDLGLRVTLGERLAVQCTACWLPAEAMEIDARCIRHDQRIEYNHDTAACRRAEFSRPTPLVHQPRLVDGRAELPF